MKYADAVRYMSGLRRFGVKLGNDRIAELLRRLGDPHRKYRVAHVTGTKGKGSTTAMIAAILRAHGFRVGGYFSPYVYDLCERIQLNGQLIGRRQFASLVARIAPEVEAISVGPLGPVTEFEVKTAAGFLYFAKQHADFAAIEVGIGGRLDATNVVDPEVSVITNVGLDHTEVLGDTIAAIAREKAGIIKPGKPVITAAQDPEALDVISAQASALGSRLLHVVPQGASTSFECVTWHGEPDGFVVETPTARYENLRLQLSGTYQCMNAACAIAAVELMGDSCGFPVHADAIHAALSEVRLPGRFSTLCTSPLVIADGAHNELSAHALAEEVRRILRGRLIVVIGMIRGHDAVSFLRPLGRMASIVYATQPTWRRAQNVEEIARAARIFCRDVRTACPPLRAARAALAEARPDDLVLITGSFYTVGDVPPEKLLRTRRSRSESAPALEPPR